LRKKKFNDASHDESPFSPQKTKLFDLIGLINTAIGYEHNGIVCCGRTKAAYTQEIAIGHGLQDDQRKNYSMNVLHPKLKEATIG
jgi:hypothetical protein